MIPGHVFTRTVETLIREPTRSSRDELGTLFRYLGDPVDRPTHGLFAGTPYADGQLFEQPAVVHLEPDDLTLLREACAYPWQEVQPSIFGSLLQGALGRERQWALGAHYTSVEDILEVVEPTIAEPWRERIEACASVEDVNGAKADLAEFVVLDPACGSGNFLYVAYRELRRLEQRLVERERLLRSSAGLPPAPRHQLFKLTNLRGIEIEPFAVKLARVTLWMAHKLAVDELGLDEEVLPLESLSGIQPGDALRLPWPRADAIIGNPPYIGTKFIRSRLGDKYAAWLSAEYGIGLKEYAVYWFRRTHQALSPGGRAGLVATNSVREGRNREVTLDWIVKNGGVIVDAIASRQWPGEANVHVSIVNWVNRPNAPPAYKSLDGNEVIAITTSLRSGEEEMAKLLSQNSHRQFFGVVPGGAGFVLSPSEAEDLLSRCDADYSDVVKPFLVGSDITSHPRQVPSRFLIDFYFNRLEEAMAFPEALDRVRRLVKPHRDVARRTAYRERWWRLEEPIVAMRQALRGLPRYIACPAQAKRFYMVWCEPSWVPSNLTSVFALADDCSLGILMSRIHTSWATIQSTTLETRPRYTSASFSTFAWPRVDPGTRGEIATLAAAIDERRRKICLDLEIGLTKLYNQVEEGAYRELADMHRGLDEAVASAYGWPASAAHDPVESNGRLLELNRQIVAGEVAYRPFDPPS